MRASRGGAATRSEARGRPADATPERAGSAGESLAARAYRLIERAIVVGDLRPGAVLSEPRLIALTACGRTPVREAVQRLARNHLLSIVPYHGAFVAPIDPRIQMKVLEMRRELDPVVAAAACRGLDDADRAHLRALAVTLRKGLAQGDNRVVVEVDGAFKTVVMRACGNPHLARTLEPIYAVARRYYFSAVQTPNLEVGGRHLDYIEQVAGGTPAAAAAAAAAFVAAIDALTRAVMLAAR